MLVKKKEVEERKSRMEEGIIGLFIKMLSA
jgi:hypothetical protein